MAERKTDSAEHIVDEMKRKARRRLVGAIVLALAAIIVLPLLLEKEPRPLGGDVSVQIPPVDEGKFINRLTGKASEKALPKAESKAITAAPAAPEPKADSRAEAAPALPAPPPPEPTPSTIGKSEPTAPKVESKAAPASAPAPKGESKATSVPTAAPNAETAVKPTAPADGRVETKAAPVAAASADAPAAAAPAAAVKAEGFVVQLAAFADDKGANALANKLKKNGYAAYVQPVETSRGTLWRVRVGGYATRPEADAARVTLKGEGYNGIIAPAQ
jgi:DedD protein